MENDPVVDDHGTQRWYKNGKLHRDNDLPAVIEADGYREWYINGILHREGDKPTVIHTDGGKDWYKNGKLHRDNDLPAVIFANGYHQEWYQHGKLHRENGPAIASSRDDIQYQEWYQHGKRHREGDQPAVIYPDGTKEWYQHGKLHREGDQPAAIYSDGTKIWYLNGEKHREGDQPAIIWADGAKEWWMNGLPHREGDQPAAIFPYGDKMWFKNGKQHRDNGLPATIFANDDQEWWEHGRFIRSAKASDFEIEEIEDPIEEESAIGKLKVFAKGFLGVKHEDTEGCIRVAAEKYNISEDEAADQVLSVIDEKRESCLHYSQDKSLFDYQKNVVDTFYTERGVIAAFATGTGKTLTAVTSASCVHSLARFFGRECNILIVTPASLVDNMAGEFKKSRYNFGDDLKVISSNIFRDVLLYNKKVRAGYKSDDSKFMATNSKRKFNFTCDKNTFLIIDEAHEFKTDYLYAFAEQDPRAPKPEDVESRVKMFVEECYPNVWKILLLTATPMLNKWYDIMNLIAAVKGVDPLTQRGVISVGKDHIQLGDRAFSRVVGTQTLAYEKVRIVNPSYFRNVIVYKDVDKDNKDFPRRKPEIYVAVFMSLPFYNKVRKLVEEVEERRKKKKKGTDEQEDKEIEELQRKISTLSDNPKIDAAANALKKGKYDKVIIYSHFLGPLRALADIIKDKIEKKKIPFYDIFIITGEDIPPSKRQVYLEQINKSPKAVIFISDAGGIGLDFKGIEAVIIYEPGVNISREEQAIGRAVRFRSHIALPPEKRKVHIYKFVLRYPEGVELPSGEKNQKTPDQKAVIRGQEKQLESLIFRNELIKATGSTVPLSKEDSFLGGERSINYVSKGKE